MGHPSTSISSFRPDLQTGFEEFDLAADRAGFIGHRVLPYFDVNVAGGTFPKIKIESLLQNRETERSPGAGYSRGDWNFTKDTFSTGEHGAEEPVDDNELKLYANYFNLEQISAARAYDAVLRNAEKRAAAMVFNTTVWTGAALATAVGTEWSTAATSTPIEDVEAAVRKVWSGTGLWPNALIINRMVFRNLRNCESIIERIASSGAGSPTKPTDITTSMLSQCFDLPHIIVAGSAKNTANKGQSAAISSIWSNEYAMVCRIAESNDLREPCIGRTFHWDEDGSEIYGACESYREESIRGDVIRVRHQVGEKLLYAEMGHLLSNISA